MKPTGRLHPLPPFFPLKNEPILRLLETNSGSLTHTAQGRPPLSNRGNFSLMDGRVTPLGPVCPLMPCHMAPSELTINKEEKISEQRKIR